MPAAWLLTHRTALPLGQLYALVHCLDVVSATVGTTLVHKGIWIRNLVASEETPEEETA